MEEKRGEFMEGHGVLREKLDIKILILFILRRLPDACEGETLAKLVLTDAGVGYFEYAECLGELVDAGHVERQLSAYRITEKGDRNGAIVESSLPYSLRARLAGLLEPMAEDMRRRALIRASHEVRDDGCRVELSMSDGLGTVVEMRLLCSGEAQAQKIEENFRGDAEGYYNRIMEMLSC